MMAKKKKKEKKATKKAVEKKATVKKKKKNKNKEKKIGLILNLNNRIQAHNESRSQHVSNTSLGYLSPFFSLGIPEVEEVGLTRLSMEMIKPSPPEEEPNHIIDAGYKFAKKRFDREFRWEPSPEIETAIFKAIFG
jgi:hypothetical protein